MNFTKVINEDEDNKVEYQKEVHENFFNSDEYENYWYSLVIKRIIYTPKKEEYLQRLNIFQLRCIVNNKISNFITDSRSSENIISATIVQKFKVEDREIS